MNRFREWLTFGHKSEGKRNCKTPLIREHHQTETDSKFSTIKSYTGAEIQCGNERKPNKKDVEYESINGENVEDEPIKFFSLFKYSSWIDKIMMLLGGIAAISFGLFYPLLVYLIGIVVNIFVDHFLAISYTYNNISEVNQTSSGELLKSFSFQPFYYFALIGVAAFCTSYTMVSLFSIAAANQAFRIKCLFMKAILRQNIGWFDANNTGDFATQITGNLKRIQEGIGENVSIFICLQSEAIFSFMAALYFGWRITLTVMAIMPFLLISLAVTSKLQAKATVREKSSYSIAGAVAEEVLSSIRTVVAFGGENKEIKRYNNYATLTKTLAIKRGLITSFEAGLTQFCVYFTCALTFWLGVTLIVEERRKGNSNFDVSNLINVLLNIMTCAIATGQSTPYYEAFNMARGAATKVYKIIERIPPIDASSEDGKTSYSITGDITLENVHFRYPCRHEVPVLRNFSLKIKSGETVALVGASGCGKTTVIQLIQRYYDVEKGHVNIDDYDVKALNIGWLRENISVVGQEPVLFSTTIAENIQYGNRNATQIEIENAAKSANVHDFINALPMGYNTIVGESGTQLSGGQKQRIAIARALVRDPKILLLDEATSALDTASEFIVQKALDKARQRRTTIIVAHRLSTIRTADKIVAIVDGKIEESGTHDDLMARRGVYYQLVTMQSTLGDEVKEPKQPMSISSIISNESDDLTHPRKFSSSEVCATDRTIEHTKMDSINDTKPVTTTLLKFSLPELPYMIVGGLFAFFAGLSPSLYGIILGDILQLLSEEDVNILRDIQYYCLLFLGVSIMSGVSSFMQYLMFSIAGEGLTLRLRKRAFSCMIYQDISWFEIPQNSVGSLCSRLSSDTADVQSAGGARISTILQSLSTLIATLIVAFYYNWHMGLVVSPVIPVILLATYLENVMISKQSLSDKSSVDEASKVAIEAIQNIRTVASLHLEDVFYVQFRTALVSPFKKSRKGSHVRGAIYGLAASLPILMYALTFYYGSICVMNGEMLYGDLLKVLETVFIGSVMISQVVAFSPDYQKAKTAAVRVFQLLADKPKIDTFTNGTNISENWSGKVNFKNVNFSYPSRPNIQILKDFNLVVASGKTTALVGSSGSGKSTCIQLLERFYNTDQGETLVDDEDIQRLKIPSLRSKLGLVSQEPVLFNYSLAENIAYGDNDRTVSIEEILTAARNANIHDFISALPQGYSTNVGDKGVQLSGGQKQRIAIARALLRNPKLLLLDEATSSLDAESEKVVQEALDKACAGRTCIVIAHRLKTIQNADVIAVIRGGRIVEKGTHKELFALRGHYFNLYNFQNEK